MQTRKLVLFPILLFLLIAVGAQAQEVRKIKATATRKNFSQLQIGYQMWQETIDAKSAGVGTEMNTHLHGVRLGYSWHRPWRGQVRWVSVYGVDFGMGVAKGAASTPLTDEVQNQPWYMVSLYPGLIYRSTSRSELGLSLPVSFRRIQWDVKAPFELDKESSFSVGLTALYMTRFSLYHSLGFSVSHQPSWKATIFGFAYQYDFRK